MDTTIEVVRLHRLENGGPIKAFCDIQFNNEYIVKGFKLVEGKDGTFVGMPSEIGKNGKWYSTFVALSDEVKSRLEEKVVSAFEE